MHCHKVERVTQVIDNKAVAVLAGLPFRLSPSLILHLKAFIANQLNNTAQSTLHSAITPYWSFYKAKPVLNKDPAKAFLPFGATVMINLKSLNTNNVAKGALAINLGTSIHHPGDNMFYRTVSPDLLPRQRWKPISIFEPFGWKSQRVLQQTYIQHETLTARDIIQAAEYPQMRQPIDQLEPQNLSPILPPTPTSVTVQRLLLTIRC
jgi:hypothetical protein